MPVSTLHLFRSIFIQIKSPVTHSLCQLCICFEASFSKINLVSLTPCVNSGICLKAFSCKSNLLSLTPCVNSGICLKAFSCKSNLLSLTHSPTFVQELMSGTLSTLIHRGIGLQAYVHPRATSNTASTAIPQSNPWVGSGSTHPGTGGTWPETIPDTIPESGPHADDPGHHPEGGSAGQRSTTTTPAMSGGTTVTLAPDGGSVTTPAPANRSEAQLFLSNSPFGGAATGAPASVAASGSAGGSSNGRAESPRAAAAAAAAAGSGGVGVSAGAGGNPEGRPSRPRKSLDDAGSSSEFTKGGTSSSSRGMASSVAGGAGTTGAGANFAAAAAAAYDNAYASMLHSGTLSAFSLPITASEGPNRSSMPGGGGSAALPSAAGSEAYAYSTTTGTLSVSTTTHISRLPPLASLPEGGENSVTPQDGLNGGVTIGSVIPEEVSADLPPGSLIRPGTMGGWMKLLGAGGLVHWGHGAGLGPLGWVADFRELCWGVVMCFAVLHARGDGKNGSGGELVQCRIRSSVQTVHGSCKSSVGRQGVPCTRVDFTR
jgi:hypothetical protein